MQRNSRIHGWPGSTVGPEHMGLAGEDGEEKRLIFEQRRSRPVRSRCSAGACSREAGRRRGQREKNGGVEGPNSRRVDQVWRGDRRSTIFRMGGGKTRRVEE